MARLSEQSDVKMNRNISLSYWVVFFYHFYFFFPVWYEYETSFASPAMVATILAVAHLLTVILELPTGALADLIGRKKTVFLGYLIVAGSWLYLSAAQNYLWLWSGYFINSIGVALASGADSALYYDSLKQINKEKLFAKVMATQGIVIRVAIVIGTFLGGTLLAIHFRLPYFLVGLSGLIAAFLTLLYTEPIIDSEVFTIKKYIYQTQQGFRQLFRSAYIRDLAVYYTLVGGLTWYFLYYLNVAYATEVGFTSQQRSLLFGIIYMLGAVINFLLIKYNVITKRIAYMLFPVLLIAGFFIASLQNLTAAVLSIALIQMAGMMRFSVLDQYANDEFDSKYRATAVSTLNMLVSVVFAVLAIVGGQVIIHRDIYALMFGLGIISMITLIPSSYVLLQRYEKRESV
jgi:MFS family permease